MDNISDMLISIKNAQLAKRASIKAPYSKVNFAIAEILKKNGQIQELSLKKKEEKSWIIVGLEYDKSGAGAIRDVKRISKPGKRIYAGYRELSAAKYRMGITILSTPQGVMNVSEAKKKKTGGEVLCKIY